jgi:serine/threonine protein phosphatase PrpC
MHGIATLALLARNDSYTQHVIARALAPVAISAERNVQPLYVFHAGDCRARVARSQ